VHSLALVVVATFVGAQTRAQSRGRCTVPEFLAIVSTLSADAMSGREAGSEGGNRASKFILSEFEKSGMTAAPSGWLQPVPLRYNRTMTQSVAIKAASDVPIDNKDDVTVQSEDTAAVAVGLADLVYVGFGISAGEATSPNVIGVVRDSLLRTLIFVATTAEETQGHFGAAWYASHPVVPLQQTAAVINIDGMNTLAPTDDFFVLPGSFVDAGGAFERAGSAVGMTLSAASFERGMDWSFDTEAFNRRGAPAVTVWQGIRARDLTPQELFRISRERNSAYHTPADTVSASWNGDAIRQHLDLLHRVGLELANAARPVVLRPNSPYTLWPPAGLQ
jgi:hypothetical protein